MARWFMFAVLIAGFALVQGDTIDAQEKGKARGYLPSGWKKLNLSDEQKLKVYAAQAKYRDQIDKLEEQIEKLKAEQQSEIVKVLTADQKRALLGEKPEQPEPTKKGEPKKDK